MIDTDEPIRRERVEEHVMLAPPRVARKGRGAVSNMQGRYEVNGRERFDDGWSDADSESAAFKTVVND